jgi:hypothetical protein
MPMSMCTHEYRVWIGACHVEAALGAVPEDFEVDAFSVSKVDAPAALPNEGSRYAHPKFACPERVRLATSAADSAALVFAYRSGKKGDFGSSLAWEALDPNGLDASRMKMAVRPDRRLSLWMGPTAVPVRVRGQQATGQRYRRNNQRSPLPCRPTA